MHKLMMNNIIRAFVATPFVHSWQTRPFVHSWQTRPFVHSWQTRPFVHSWQLRPFAHFRQIYGTLRNKQGSKNKQQAYNFRRMFWALYSKIVDVVLLFEYFCALLLALKLVP